jgi:hypothetical protein
MGAARGESVMEEIPMSLDKYIIFRRSDGYINCSVNSLPSNYVTGGAEPEVKGGPRRGQGIPITFELLGTFDTFDEAFAFEEEQRGQQE